MTATVLERADFTRGAAQIATRMIVRGRDTDGEDHTYTWAPHVLRRRVDEDLNAEDPAEPRVVALGEYERTTTGDDGQPRLNVCRVVVADIPGPGQAPDYLLREMLDNPNQYGLYNTDVEIQWIRVQDWLAGKQWESYFRGEVQAYALLEGYLFELTLKGWGTRRVDREFAVPKLFEDFPALPVSSLPLYAPFLLGRRSDEGSEADPPQPTIETSSGAYNGPDLLTWPLTPTVSGPVLGEGKSANPRAGFAALVGTILTGLTVTETTSGLGGFSGSGQLAVRWVGMATFTPTGGSEGDPDTFLPRDCQYIGAVAPDSVIDMACDAAGVGGTYHFYLGAVFTGNDDIRWLQRIDSASPAATFNRANWGVGGRQEDEHVSAGAVRLSTGQADGYIARRVYAVVAVMPDGTTSIAALILGIQDGYRRPFRCTWAPVIDAIEYRVLRSRDGATGTLSGVTSGLLTWRFESTDFDRQYLVPTSQINGDGDLYFENDPLDNASGDPAVLKTPSGQLPLIPCGGPYTDDLGVSDWYFWAIAYGWEDGDEVESLYQNGVRLADAALSAGNFAVPGKGDYASRFATEYLEVASGRWYWGIYVRGTDHADALSGALPLTINVARAQRNGVDQLARVLDNFVLPDSVQPESGGAWLATIPAWADSTPRRSQDAFDLTEAELDALLAAGLDRSVYLPAAETRSKNSDVLAPMLRGIDAGMYWRANGQVGAVPHPPVAFATAFAQQWTHVTEVIGVPLPQDDDTRRANQLIVRFDVDDRTGAYRQTLTLNDAAAKAQYRDFDAIPVTLDLPTVTTAAAAADIGGRALQRLVRPERTVPVTRAFHAIHDEIGTRPLLTHPEGVGVGGFNARKLQIRSVLAEVEQMRVTARCHDLDWISLTQSNAEVTVDDVELEDDEEHDVDLEAEVTGSIIKEGTLAFVVRSGDLPSSVLARSVRTPVFGAVKAQAVADFVFREDAGLDWGADWTRIFRGRGEPSVGESGYGTLMAVGSYTYAEPYIWLGWSTASSNAATLEVFDGDETYSTVRSSALVDHAHKPFALRYTASTTTLDLIVGGAVVASVVADLATLSLADIDVLGGDSGAQAGTCIAQERTWQAALTLDEIAAEVHSRTAVRTDDLFSDAPLSSVDDLVDAAHGHDWTALNTMGSAGGFASAPVTIPAGHAGSHRIVGMFSGTTTHRPASGVGTLTVPEDAGALIPIGTLAFSGFGDAPIVFTDATGAIKTPPASAPKVGAPVDSSGCYGLVQLSNGAYVASGTDTAGHDSTQIFNADFTARATQASGQFGLAADQLGYAYITQSGFSGGKWFTDLQRIDRDGVILDTWRIAEDVSLDIGTRQGVAVNASGTIAYSWHGGPASAVYKFDLSGNTDLGVLIADSAQELFPESGTVLPNGDLLLGYGNGGGPHVVKRYDSAGSLQDTYTLPHTALSPCLTIQPAVDVDGTVLSTAFWCSYYSAAAGYGVTVAKVQVSDGAVLAVFDTPDDGFEWDGPFCVVREAIAA